MIYQTILHCQKLLATSPGLANLQLMSCMQLFAQFQAAHV